MDNKIKGFTQAWDNGDKTFLLGMKWGLVQKPHPMLFRFALKELAKAAGFDYGFKSTIKKLKTSKSHTMQYALCDNVESEKTVFAGAQFIAKNIKTWSKHDNEKTSVFIKTIFEGDSVVGFWICGISYDGKILSEYDCFVKDRFEAINKLADMSITEDMMFVILDSDISIENIIQSYATKVDMLFSEIKITKVEQSDFDLKMSNFDESISRLHKESPIKVAKIGAGVISLSLLLGMGFGTVYYIQKDAIDNLSSTDIKEQLEVKSSDYSKSLSSMKGSKYWDDESYRETTLEQFISTMGTNLYEPIEIPLIMREVTRSLPKYAAEWELKTIHFVDNKFLAFYDRIEGGKGVYFLLDEHIKQYSDYNENLAIMPFSIINEGTTRIFEIIPLMQLNRQKETENMLDKLREESKRKSLLARQIKRTKDVTDEKIGLIERYENLTFKEKWIELVPNELNKSFIQLDDNMNASIDRVKTLQADLSGATPLSLQEELIVGNVLDFVSMMQLDSLFEWSFPSLIRTFPSKGDLGDKNKKPGKTKKGSKPQNLEIYGPAIESYEVVIQTRSGDEVGKINSYGIADMIELGRLINKPFVHAKIVEYDIATEQWIFTLNFYRKTAEYDNRVRTQKNKEVSK